MPEPDTIGKAQSAGVFSSVSLSQARYPQYSKREQNTLFILSGICIGLGSCTAAVKVTSLLTLAPGEIGWSIVVSIETWCGAVCLVAGILGVASASCSSRPLAFITCAFSLSTFFAGGTQTALSGYSIWSKSYVTEIPCQTNSCAVPATLMACDILQVAYGLLEFFVSAWSTMVGARLLSACFSREDDQEDVLDEWGGKPSMHVGVARESVAFDQRQSLATGGAGHMTNDYAIKNLQIRTA